MEDSGSRAPGLHGDGAEGSIGGRHRFAHEAMATVFEIVCVHEDRAYAEQAAAAAFDMIDRLEMDLTCHRSSSDIARINRLRRGEAAPVGLWTMDCLLISRHFYEETGGAFDISLGSGMEAVELAPADCMVCVHRDNIRLDLGGIGKGYAVDRAADLLLEWDVTRVLIHGGCSSVLALEPPPGLAGWPLTISIPGGAGVLEHITARSQVWSASGIQKKDHIIDPRTGFPVRDRPGVWVSGSLEALGETCAALCSRDVEAGKSPSAAAEALSTAFMVMPWGEIEDCCRRHPGVEARILVPDPSNPGAAPSMRHFQGVRSRA